MKREFPDFSRGELSQVFVTYRNTLLYRILKVSVFTYNEQEWEILVQKDIMRTRNRIMKPSNNVLEKLFYQDVIYEINNRFLI